MRTISRASAAHLTLSQASQIMGVISGLYWDNGINGNYYNI